MKSFCSLNSVLGTLFFIFSIISCNGLPLLDTENSFYNGEITNLTTSQNNSTGDLYVIKAVVYEIGILTNVSDANETSSESQERVDLTFFDAHKNDSHIDLGKIPLPVQTNISGQVLTAIAPIQIGAFSNTSELLETLPLTGTILNITNSNTSLIQLSTNNVTANNYNETNPTIITADEIEKIPDISDILPELGFDISDILPELGFDQS